MTTYTHTFREVKVPAKRNLKCRCCGKRFTRAMTFTQTINPFNKNTAGEVKTFPEIRRELMEEAQAWAPEPLCTGCVEALTCPQCAGGVFARRNCDACDGTGRKPEEQANQ